jgi:endonuclease YncB( thermonuclease family)
VGRGQLGSVVLLLAASLLILRPWEDHNALGGPGEARAFVVRAVDGDTIEVRLGKRLDEVRYIGMLSRVSSPTLRLPVGVTG